MSSILNIVGSNVRRYRKKAGLTQEQLAEYAGLHRTYIGAVERAQKNISAMNIARIARVLGVEPHILLDPNSDEAESKFHK